MFTLKYRPNNFNEVVGNKPIIDTIKSMMPNIPHLLFYGAPGTGKTTLAKIIVKELDCDFKEINASDERGIHVMQTTVKSFANTQSMNGKFKVVILDEADNITSDAQAALRRIMEQNANNCKFIFACNYIEKIIEPIQSRCKGGIFEFKPIEIFDFNFGIQNILTKEQMTITTDALEELYNQSKGDMRIVDKLYAISCVTKNITIDHIRTIKYNNEHKELLKYIKNNNYIAACNIIKKEQVKPLFDELIQSDIDDDKKRKLVLHFAEYDYRAYFSKMEYIQLYALVANIIDVLNIQNEINLKKLENIHKTPFG